MLMVMFKQQIIAKTCAFVILMSRKIDKKSRGVEAGWAGWACAHPIFSLTFIEMGYLPTHFLLPEEKFLVLPTHFEEGSYAPVSKNP